MRELSGATPAPGVFDVQMPATEQVPIKANIKVEEVSATLGTFEKGNSICNTAGPPQHSPYTNSKGNVPEGAE